VRLGLGDRPINQGPINLGYLGELVVRAAGGIEYVVRLSVRFRGNVFAGDRVVCTGKVIEVDEMAGTARLELLASVGENAVAAGEATVKLTTESNGKAG
jgi:acyl-CoA thioesterase FadM